MPSGLSTFRDKAVVDRFAGLEDFLDTLELMGCRDVEVDALDDSTFVVSWLSPTDDSTIAPHAVTP